MAHHKRHDSITVHVDVLINGDVDGSGDGVDLGDCEHLIYLV